MTLAHQFERIDRGRQRHRPHRHRRPHRDRVHARRAASAARCSCCRARTPIPSVWSGRNCPGWTRSPSTSPAAGPDHERLATTNWSTTRDPQGEKIRRDRSGAQHLVGRDPARRAGVGAAGARAGALRAARRHPAEPRRWSTCSGPVPAEGDLWVRAQRERSGKQIELISAEMLALGPDGKPRPVARASGWRLQTLDTAGRRARARAAAASGRRRAEPRHEEGLGPQLRAQPRLAVADRAARTTGRASRGSSPRSTWSRARP